MGTHGYVGLVVCSIRNTFEPLRTGFVFGLVRGRRKPNRSGSKPTPTSAVRFEQNAQTGTRFRFGFEQNMLKTEPNRTAATLFV